MMRKIIIFALAFVACKEKDNKFSFDRGSYAEYKITTIGKIPDTTFNSSVIIYYPPNYNEQDLSVKYPIIYFLHPFGGNYTYYKSVYDLGTIMSYLVAKDEINPAILVFVNGINQFGGSFYVNSLDPLNGQNVYGKYEDYIIEEIIPQVENVILNKDKLNGQRYVAGYSMGGYGSVWLSISNPDKFNMVGSISGPLGFLAFSQPEAQSAVLNILKQENADFNNQLPPSFASLAPTLGPEKSLTTFVVALSAAFSPKIDNCSNFLDPDSAKYIYITAQSGSTCVGFRLPVYKDLSGVNTNVLGLWYSKDPLTFFTLGDPSEVINRGIKYYISTGNKGDALETVISSMDSALVEVMKQKYSNNGKNPDDYIWYNVVTGSTDPFKFNPTHNQYVYQELANVLRFFLRK